MKYKEIVKYFAIAGIGINLLFSQPVNIYATELTNEVIVAEDVATKFNANDFVIENGVLKDYTGNASQVVIPSGVTSIGNYAFQNCDSIITVTIPNGVTSIGNYAFQGCDRLESVTISKTVETIGESAFNSCGSLMDISLQNSGVISIGYQAFYDCGSLAEIVLPKSMKSIGQEAFRNCSSATKIVIPSGVTGIGYGAFRNCDKVKEISIPGTVTSLGQYAFYACDSLKTVIIADGATSLGAYAFSNCSSLEEVSIPGSILTIGDEAFGEDTVLTKVTIGDGVKNINFRAFYGCESLEEIVLPKSMKSVGQEAFRNCSSLIKAIMLDGIKSIGQSAFAYTPDNFTIYGVKGSYVHEYAEAKEIPFQELKATITTQPKSVSIAEGKTASFTVKASGVDLAYQWQYCPSGSSSWSNSSESGSKTETLKIEGTQAKNGYKYRCIVTDGMGNKVTSSSATLTVTTNKPTSVSGLTIGGRATDALRLNWNKNSNASGYIIEQYKNGKWTRIARIGSNNTTTYRVEGLSASASYKFRVQSFGFDGNTAIYSSWKNIDGKTLPTSVSGLKIGGRATDALRLNWDKNSNASGYIIEQYKNGKWTRIAKVEKNSTITYRVEKLSKSTTYKFRVQTYNFDGSTPLYSSWQYVNGTTK